MNTKQATKIATDCIRHVLKETKGELEFKWIKEPQKEQLEIWIKKYEETILFLEELNAR